MDEITNFNTIDTVEKLTNAINTELNSAAASFVRIGFLLKKARDENIITDAGYPDIYVYANTKFRLDKSQVSRFIRINDRFSVNGYSEQLQDKYEGYGSTKLSLMLTLPDEINEELSPEYSKTEINAIKTEWETESKISDMEVMMEEKRDEPDDFLAMIIKELNDEHPEPAIYLNKTVDSAEKMGFTVNDAVIRDAYIPDGIGMYSIRIPGQGRFMISMKPEGIVIANMRTPEEKSPLTWEEFKDILLEDLKDRDFPKEKTKEPEKKKSEKVKTAKTLNETVAPVQPEKIPEEDTEVIPAGQSMDNAPRDVREVEDNSQEVNTAAGVEEHQGTDQSAAGSEELQSAADDEPQMAAGEGQTLTSSQTDMLEWLDLLRRKVIPEDGSRPDWTSILDEIKSMERFVKQFTY